jgi:hypothetical protein
LDNCEALSVTAHLVGGIAQGQQAETNSFGYDRRKRAYVPERFIYGNAARRHSPIFFPFVPYDCPCRIAMFLSFSNNRKEPCLVFCLSARQGADRGLVAALFDRNRLGRLDWRRGRRLFDYPHRRSGLTLYFLRPTCAATQSHSKEDNQQYESQ